MSGVARRSWARNEHAMEVSVEFNNEKTGVITLPYLVKDELIENAVKDMK